MFFDIWEIHIPIIKHPPQEYGQFKELAKVYHFWFIINKFSIFNRKMYNKVWVLNCEKFSSKFVLNSLEIYTENFTCMRFDHSLVIWYKDFDFDTLKYVCLSYIIKVAVTIFSRTFIGWRSTCQIITDAVPLSNKA